MAERRFSGIVAALVLVLISAVIWDALVPPRRVRPTPVRTRPPATAPAPTGPRPVAVSRSESTASQGAVAQPAPRREPTYLELLARAGIRRRIRESAGLTYLNEMFALSGDSMLHRWDNRVLRPVRVFLGPDTVANFRPALLEAVRSAFARWQATGIPVRFDVGADSATAEVRVRWVAKFAVDRTGQTDLQWDQDGHLLTGVVALATFDPQGRPLGDEEIRIVALHEIGHLVGLDHSPDSTDLMFPTARVRDLSGRDVQSALLLYELVPGSFK